jgi:dipeptidyl aminopeptidase/acylaminoacyl peptidase
MPAETWPVTTPVGAMLDRVLLRSKARRHRRRTRQAAMATVLTLATVVATGYLLTSPSGSRLKTTPAEGSRGNDESSNRETPGNQPTDVGGTESSGAGNGGSTGPAGSGVIGSGGPAGLPNSSVPTVPHITTTTAPPKASVGSREIALVRGNRLWLVHADGSDLSPVTAADSAHYISDPAWAPDGRSMVAFDWHGDAMGRAVGHLSIVDLDGNLHPLTRDEALYGNPKWSPDGKRIAYARAKDRVDWSVPEPELWVMDADGSNPRKLTSLTGGQVAWSPDGRRLLAWCQEGGSLCTANVDGTDVRQVPNSSGVFEFAWSPDGQRLAFQAANEQSHGWHVGTMRADGSDRRVLLEQWGTFGIDWSPDSRTLVMSAAPDSEPPPSSCVLVADSVHDSCPDPEPMRIWRINADGTDHRPLTPGPGDYRPSWRPIR